MELIRMTNVLNAVQTIQDMCDSVQGQCFTCPLGFEAQSGKWKCSVIKNKWNLEEHKCDKPLKKNVPNTWTDGHRLHFWSFSPHTDDSDGVPGERFMKMISEIVPCLTVLLLGKVYCMLGFIPFLLEEKLITTQLVGVSASVGFIVSIMAGICVYTDAYDLGKISVQGTIVSTVAYAAMAPAIFTPQDFLAPHILPVFICLFSVVIAFCMACLFVYSFRSGSTWLRACCFVAGIFTSVYDIGYNLTASQFNLHSVYASQLFVWAALIITVFGWSKYESRE